jgi:dTDP-4-amino-4,6-dideoxygalactose transaminase
MKDFKITTAGLTIPFTGLRKQYNNIKEEILDATDRVLRSGNLMNGIYTKEFETWLAKKNNSKYAITCHSGTQALEIIAQYYITRDWDSRCHVLVPAITYPATINAFLRSGWDVTIVDTDAYGIMDRDHAMPELVNYNAIVLVGLYGAPIRNGWELMANIIIEDAAQHWLSDRGRRKGHAAAISFDPMMVQ